MGIEKKKVSENTNNWKFTQISVQHQLHIFIII